MADTTIRWALANHLVELLQNHPSMAGVTVAPGWTGDKRPVADLLYVGEITGDLVIPVGTGGRKHLDDKFRIPFFIDVKGIRDIGRARARLSEIVAAAQDVLAEDPTLGNFDGLLSAEITDVAESGIQTPNDGYFAWGTFTVSAHARLT